ncbi:Uncharacterized membrane protein [Roseateles sp. YR242]|uniref:DUF1003 domain-containing protein n=1 Tax=Roseateles sp. YR242 TaxID=1855305 RepID=UPI0008CB0165|nr:DUF1003 domain-containing protein [Roseateles sp. YR242]SEL84781.1 Uncharacterized membrane protein [Roseateles sp. YR242]
MTVAHVPHAPRRPTAPPSGRRSRPEIIDDAGGDNDEDLASLTRENIAAVARLEAALEGQATGADRFADQIRRFCSSTQFIAMHVIWFAGWILWNTLHGMPHFDPYPFTFLTLVVSLEAIFLSAFVLISQAHSGRLDEQRNRLDLQINLLTEQENTKMLVMLDRIAEAVGVPTQDDARLRAMQQAVAPGELAEQIAEAIQAGAAAKRAGRKDTEKDAAKDADEAARPGEAHSPRAR